MRVFITLGAIAIVSLGMYVWMSLALSGAFARLKRPRWHGWVPVMQQWSTFVAGGISGIWAVVSWGLGTVGVGIAVPGFLAIQADASPSGITLVMFAVGLALTALAGFLHIAMWGIAAHGIAKVHRLPALSTLIAVLFPPVWASLLAWGPYGKAIQADPVEPADEVVVSTAPASEFSLQSLDIADAGGGVLSEPQSVADAAPPASPPALAGPASTPFTVHDDQPVAESRPSPQAQAQVRDSEQPSVAEPERSSAEDRQATSDASPAATSAPALSALPPGWAPSADAPVHKPASGEVTLRPELDTDDEAGVASNSDLDPDVLLDADTRIEDSRDEQLTPTAVPGDASPSASQTSAREAIVPAADTPVEGDAAEAQSPLVTTPPLDSASEPLEPSEPSEPAAPEEPQPAVPLSQMWGAPDPAPLPPASPTPTPVSSESAADDDEDDDGDDFTVLSTRLRETWALVVGDTRYPLTGDPLTLGRKAVGKVADTPGTLGIADPTRTISKAHAHVELRDGTWWIKDLGSTNGTLIRAESGAEITVPADNHVPVEGDLILGDLVAMIEQTKAED